MKGKVVSGLPLLLFCTMLLLTSCGAAATTSKSTTGPASPAATSNTAPPPVTTTPSVVAPEYGGTLNLYSAAPSDWEWNQTVTFDLLYDHLWGADWTKGAAGGYGTNESDWTNNYDNYSHYQGWAATSWRVAVDAQTNKATIVYEIRQGIHYYKIPGNEASALVNGREMTADDVVSTMKWQFEPVKGRYGYAFIPELRTAEFVKTGPWEVTVRLNSAEQIMPALTNLGGKRWLIRPPEIREKYGSFNGWDYQIATGPFMMTDYVKDSQATLKRNPDYWAKDPIGPGKGNQLPYIDGIKYLVIPDLSTRYAAFRTGKLDQIFDLNLEDAAQIRQTVPKGLKELQYYPWTSVPGAVYMRIDMTPTSDLRVRQALMMATDFESIRRSVNQGQGEIITFPHMPSKAYRGLYIGLGDPDLPAQVKELYTYNPDKAKQLLKDAGYPNGFKTQVLCTTNDADYLSIYKNMWAKVGVDLEITIRDAATISALVTSKENPPFTVGATGSVGRFYQPEVFAGEGNQNRSNIRKDPTIEAALTKIRGLALTDMNGAMKIMRDLTKDYMLPQAFAIPTPMAQYTVFWYPWLKNYSGEIIIPLGTYNRWAQWTWLDTDLKKSMGY